MRCGKCGKEFSPKVYEIHKKTCDGNIIIIPKKADTLEKSREDLRKEAAKLGIKGYSRKTKEDLLKAIKGEK